MPAEQITITIDGHPVQVAPNTSVAAAMLNAGIRSFRSSTGGQPRSAMCGMGVCFECRVTIDGLRHQLSCQVVCRAGMEVRSDAG